MLIGLDSMDIGRLRMSVGYGTHKKGRPLSPIEVGQLLLSARERGFSLRECAIASGLNGTGHIGRFLRILELPNDIQHLVNWGADNGTIGFSSAVELASLKNTEDQLAVANSILSDGITSKEVRQIRQVRSRSGYPIDSCIKDILRMRPTIEKRFVFIGSIIENQVEEKLVKLTQTQRDTILESVIAQIQLKGAHGRLGNRFFTLVGDECFKVSMDKIGKEKLETRLRTHIAETVEHGRNR